MAYFWKLPPIGSVNVNVHGATPFIPFPNGNTNGIVMVIRNCEGELMKLSTCVIAGLSPLQNQLKAIHHGLIKAFDDNFQNVILKTDNLEAFQILKNFPHGAAEEVREVAEQILIRLHDPRRACAIMYVYPDRNKVAIYLARLGGKKCKQLYTLTRPVGAVEELLSLDLGFGPLETRFMDIVIPNEEEDTVDFGLQHLGGAGVVHGGYTFHEDYFAVHNEVFDIPEVVPVHEIAIEEYIVGQGMGEEGFNGDIAYTI